MARPERAMRWRDTLLCVVRTKCHGRRSSGHEKARSVSGQGPFEARASPRPAGKLVLLHADAEPTVCVSISARGAPVHGGAAPWRSSCAASARRDDARYCASPNVSRAAPFRHQPAAPDAASALAFQQQTVQQQASERHVAISHVIPKNTMNLPNFQHNFQHEFAIFYDIFASRRSC